MHTHFGEQDISQELQGCCKPSLGDTLPSQGCMLFFNCTMLDQQARIGCGLQAGGGNAGKEGTHCGAIGEDHAALPLTLLVWRLRSQRPAT